MKDILYFNTLEDIKIVDMLRTTSKERELPNLIILTILSAGAGEITPVFLKLIGEMEPFVSVDNVGTKFILDGREITSSDFLVVTKTQSKIDFNFFGLLFEDSKEHILKVSLTDFTIKPHTFIANVYLKKVIIGTSITSIGNSAFYGCSGLTSLSIGNSVTTIGESAFMNCDSLAEVTIGNSVTSIGENAFKNCSGLTSVTIPNSVIMIGDYAFIDCSSLTSVIIPNSVTSISDGAFEGCSSLTLAIIPNSVTTIGNEAFTGCTSLINLVIPNSVTSIGESAFAACSGLTSVTIPNSVTSIGNYAFNNCSSLASITSLATTAPTISNNTFYNVKTLGTLHVPSGSNYSTWMSTSNYYLGKYNWTKVEDA